MGAPETPRDNTPSRPGAGSASVEVVYALPRRQRVVRVAMPPAGLSAAEAVERSGLLAEFPEIQERTLVIGVFGTVCDGSRALRDGDRVEIYRPLRQDPRTGRRARVATSAARGKRR